MPGTVIGEKAIGRKRKKKRLALKSRKKRLYIRAFLSLSIK